MSDINPVQKDYFNQHLHGVGYISNVRTITPPKGDPYLVVKVASLCGPVGDHSYTYFNCRVCGTLAKEVIKKCAQAVNSGETVFVRFLLSGIWVIPFIYQQGEKAGQPGANIQANLLSVFMVMINGEVFYTAPTKEENTEKKQKQDSESVAQANEAGLAVLSDEAASSNASALPLMTQENTGETEKADSDPAAQADEDESTDPTDEPVSSDAPALPLMTQENTEEAEKVDSDPATQADEDESTDPTDEPVSSDASALPLMTQENTGETEKADSDPAAQADEDESTDPTDPPDEPGPSGAPAALPLTDAEHAA